MRRKGSAPPTRGRAAWASGRAANPALQAAVLEVVDTQLRAGLPPATQQTVARLVAAGYSGEEARRLAACAVISEIVDVLQRSQPYDEARYVAALHRLPTLPWEE